MIQKDYEERECELQSLERQLRQELENQIMILPKETIMEPRAPEDLHVPADETNIQTHMQDLLNEQVEVNDDSTREIHRDKIPRTTIQRFPQRQQQ